MVWLGLAQFGLLGPGYFDSINHRSMLELNNPTLRLKAGFDLGSCTQAENPAKAYSGWHAVDPPMIHSFMCAFSNCWLSCGIDCAVARMSTKKQKECPQTGAMLPQLAPCSQGHTVPLVITHAAGDHVSTKGLELEC